MNRTAPALSVVAVLLALAPAAAAAPKPPKPPKPTGNPTLLAAPNPVVAGRTLTLSGKLSGANNSGKTVNLFADPFPFDSFTNVGSATTNANGDYQLTLKPILNTRYQARQGANQSALVTVLVRPAVSLKLSDYTPKRGQRVRFSGRVCPEHDGASLSIQRRSGGKYRTVARTTLRDVAGSTCSSYRRSLRVRRDGRYRAVIGTHSDHATGLSRSRVANAHG
jgi:hypothetical protein